MDEIAAGPSPWAYLDALGEGVYGVDALGRCLFANAAAVRILGYDRADELVGLNMHEAIHHTRPDGSAFPQAECPLLHTGHSGRPVRLENELLWRRDGTSFFAEYSSYPVADGAHAGGSVVTFAENLVRQDARVRLAVQHAVSQVLAEAVGRDEMLARILQTIGRGFGWDAGLFWRQDEAGGDSLALAGRWHARDADGRDGLPGGADPAEDGPGGLALRAWRERGPVHVADPAAAPADARLPAAAGRGLRSGIAFPVWMGQDVAGVVEFYDHDAIEADDTLLEAVAVLGQMMGRALERHRIASDLRRSEARFRAIANTMPQLSWMTDASGRITWFNDRWHAYTGTTPEQMAASGWTVVHHPDHVERVERTLGASVASGAAWEDTFPLRAADGSYRWFLSRALPIRTEAGGDDGGSVIGWFGTATDITALREAERSQALALEEAEAANEAKSLFLANMSHELRTPLSAIIGYAEMLVEEVEDGAGPEEVVRDIRKVETNARHLLGLINDVLDLSKVESGKMETYAETFDVADMVAGIAATAEALVRTKENRLEVVLAPGLGSMHSDITRIRQVLLNLLSNAAKFTEKGLVTLSATRQRGTDGADWVTFSVADTGLGMSEEQVARLFQRFQQADASTTRRFGGTGLGLSLTKAFGALLGGEVGVRSVPGEGSTFFMRVPATLPAAAPPDDAAPAMEPDGRQVVLVIDDDATQRELTSRFLERTGYAARLAADGASGLALAREIHPHVILLDVTMPGMDGWSVLGALKADPALSDIPVVMVTFLEQRALASSLGAADYIMKPVDWNRLSLVMDRFRSAEGDVLVVDDDADTRLRLRHVLERHGWSVAEAQDGRAALEHVALALPRVILLDLAMPVMDGFEFIERLRERPGCGTVPVVVLTSLSLTLEDRRRLRGANQVLNKGNVSLDELTRKLLAFRVPAR
ncbi:MAG: response regulator [Janthinobacterium lividum]